MTISKELEEAKAILHFVKSLDFVNPDRIGALGLSMGGAVASMLAGDCKEDISTLCLWAPAANMKEIPLKGKPDVEIREFYQKGFIDINGFALGTGFMEDAMALDILKRAAPYDKRTLLIHGNKDEVVPLSVSQQYLNIYGNRTQLHVIEGGDHTFNHLIFEKEVLDTSVNFLTKELKVY